MTSHFKFDWQVWLSVSSPCDEIIWWAGDPGFDQHFTQLMRDNFKAATSIYLIKIKAWYNFGSAFFYRTLHAFLMQRMHACLMLRWEITVRNIAYKNLRKCFFSKCSKLSKITQCLSKFKISLKTTFWNMVQKYLFLLCHKRYIFNFFQLKWYF